MRNASKRLLSLVLAVVMVVSMLPLTALAEEVVITPGENETPVLALTETEAVDTKAVSYSDGTTTTDYFVGTEDTANNVYATMQAAVEAAFAKWNETKVGTITLHQD